jgi:16S rRNA (adenine1518-N6/adenine1519-N6)-dimethyltransferase
VVTGDGLLGAADVRALADEIGVRPTKRLGQNFVIDPNTVRRIVRSAALRDDDVVLEVGPGLGSLTLGLLPQVRHVVAVEVDPALAERLPRTAVERAPEVADRLSVIRADALSLSAVPSTPTALVANLPYNVAVPVVLHLLEVVESLRTVLVMVQKEVADRLVAAPGSRTYGVPSVKARWPRPHVDSGLVRMTRREPPVCAAGRVATFAVVDGAFAQRRKTLRAALASLAGSPAAAEEALRTAGVDPGARGEQLDVAGFARIADALDLRGRA